MADFTIPDHPKINKSIRKMEITDPAHVDFINNMIQSVFENTLFLNRITDSGILDYNYTGVDLSIAFSDEIKGFSDPWAWIKSRISSNDFSGIHISDYIPLTLNGQILKMQVAGIDTYYHEKKEINHHIDFISKDCYDYSITWNESGSNNGINRKSSPFMASDIYSRLNNNIYALLPAEIKNVITEKYVTNTEMRYKSGTALTDSTLSAGGNFGYLWLPTEYEIFGSIIWGTKGVSQGEAKQYPIFKNDRYRIKGRGDGGRACMWWTATPSGGNSTKCVLVHRDGYADNSVTSDYADIPICFRIEKNN